MGLLGTLGARQIFFIGSTGRQKSWTDQHAHAMQKETQKSLTNFYELAVKLKDINLLNNIYATKIKQY